MTVVVDHDRGRVVRACAGHGKRQLNAFLDLLTEGRRAGIEVTADGARRIADGVAERAPGAELAADPFHAVSRATGALDELRRRSWREAGSRPAPKRRRGRPRKGEQAPPDPAGPVKVLGVPAAQEPRGPHGGAGLGALGAQGGRRAAVARLPAQGRAAGRVPGRPRARGGRARPPARPGVQVQDTGVRRALQKVRRKRDGILRSTALGVSNARAGAVNNKIKVAIRQGYGFRNTDDPIALIMLRCSDLRPALPGRAAS